MFIRGKAWENHRPGLREFSKKRSARRFRSRGFQAWSVTISPGPTLTFLSAGKAQNQLNAVAAGELIYRSSVVDDRVTPLEVTADLGEVLALPGGPEDRIQRRGVQVVCG